MKYICFISIPRTGTNHVGRIVSGFANIRSQYELFHHDAAFTLSNDEVAEFSNVVGRSFKNFEDPELVDFARSRPGAFLDAYARVCAPHFDAASYKIFPDHLEDAPLRDEVLARDDTSVIIVRRRHLASFVSLRKAEKVQEYIDVDTTNVKVTLRSIGFHDWRRNVLHWYETIEEMLRSLGKEPQYLSYENEIDTDPYTLAGVLVEKFAKAGIQTTRDHGEPPALEKQDKSRNIEDAIANWDEFKSGLDELGVPIDD